MQKNRLAAPRALAAVICEYNPLHLGHLYHLRETERRTGCGIVLVMSGPFSQRGEPALSPTRVKTELALRAGAQLVLGLPVAFAVAAADDFALYAMRMLNCFPDVAWLSFGSECGDLDRLLRARELLDAWETGGRKRLLREPLRRGCSFSAAWNAAAREVLAAEGLEDLLAGSNDLLALSYLKALRQTNSRIRPLAVRRAGTYGCARLDGQDADPTSSPRVSATAIRAALEQSRRPAGTPREDCPAPSPAATADGPRSGYSAPPPSEIAACRSQGNAYQSAAIATPFPPEISACRQSQGSASQTAAITTPLPSEISACRQSQGSASQTAANITPLPPEISACRQSQNSASQTPANLTPLPPEVAALVPAEVAGALSAAPLPRADLFYAMVRAQLVLSAPQALNRLYGMSEGLEHRLLRVLDEAPDVLPTLEDYLDAVCTKRYSRSHVRRLLIRVLLSGGNSGLGVTKDLVARAKKEPTLLTVRGVRRGSEELLARSTAPVFAESSKRAELPPAQQALARLDERAERLFSLLLVSEPTAERGADGQRAARRGAERKLLKV